eukprot:c27609_g1_i3 orf=448-1818(+)
MEGVNSSEFFANDGSFLERFKQLQNGQGSSDISKTPDSSEAETSGATISSVEGLKSTITVKKATFLPAGFKLSSQKSPSPAAAAPSASTTGKLAFSLKQKSRLPVNPLKLIGDDEEEEDDGRTGSDRQAKKQKHERSSEISSPHSDTETETIPDPPTDPEVKKVADKLASFVAKNGRQFENITRQKNPGDTPFWFLFDVGCPEYKYYEYRISQEDKVLTEARVKVTQNTRTAGSSTALRPASYQSRIGSQHTNYQTPASALYAGSDDQRWFQQSGVSQESLQAETLSTADSLAMMEFYMKKAAQEDLHKPPRYAKDEMPPPASLQPHLASSKKGHHMGDYIPQEELEKFLAKCNDAVARKSAIAAAERAKIQADNVGHKLLSKMGWKEGEGLGSGKSGRADPVQAGAVKLNNLGVGAEQPGEVTPEDDIYEQYKKRMMLGYRFRPNPLNNPRKAYY